jgi:hypothetical protein
VANGAELLNPRRGARIAADVAKLELLRQLFVPTQPQQLADEVIDETKPMSPIGRCGRKRLENVAKH